MAVRLQLVKEEGRNLYRGKLRVLKARDAVFSAIRGC